MTVERAWSSEIVSTVGGAALVATLHATTTFILAAVTLPASVVSRGALLETSALVGLAFALASGIAWSLAVRVRRRLGPRPLGRERARLVWAPYAVGVSVLGGEVAVLLALVAGVLEPALPTRVRWAFACFATACFGPCTDLLVVGVRRWSVAATAGLVDAERRRASFHRRLGWRLVAPSFVPLFGIIGAAIGLGGASAIPVVAIASALGVAVVVLAMRFARRAAEDLDRLAAFVALSSRGAGLRRSPEARPAVPQPRFSEVSQVVVAFLRFEARARRSMHHEIRARSELESAQRIRARLMAYVSHDLRSPVSSIIGFADLLLQGGDGPLNTEQRTNVRAIRRAGRSLLRLIATVLDAAKLAAGRMRFDVARCSAVELVTEAVEQLRDDDQRALEVSRIATPGLASVTVDPVQTSRALRSVFEHAVASTGGLAIDIFPGEVGSVCVDVPTGASGDPFVALPAGRGSDPDGLAGRLLALELARELLVAQGGSLSYEEGEDEGRIVVSLPTTGLGTTGGAVGAISDSEAGGTR